MKQVTSFLLLMLFLLSTAVYSQKAGSGLKKSELDKKVAISTTDLSVDTYNGVKPVANPAFLNTDVNFSSSDPSRSVLYENGPMVTHPGGGAGGNDASVLQSTSGPLLTTYGFGAQQTAGNSMADDFVVTGTWTLSSLKFYAYQTGSTTTSTITGIYVQIWNGAPNAGGTVVWGDLTTNRLASTTWSSIYRSIETNIVASDRPIMEVVANAAGCVLNAGTYWVQYQFTGSLASGPWAPPISIWGTGLTGNALQLTSTGWAAAVSGTAPNTYQQGLPFIVEGTSGGLLNNDLSVISILSPSTGANLGSAEPVTIRIQNVGLNSQSNFPVFYTINGGAQVTGNVSATIPSLGTYDFTFPTTANLSTYGTYLFHACTNLTGDQNTANNCFDKSVENLFPTYCDASTTTEDEYIANVLCGDINNSSGWQGGVANYTNITTTINAGMSEPITITNGTPWASDIVYCWVDWNKDFTFGTGEELFMLTNVGGTGATFTGAIATPANTPDGEYRMRIRMTYSTAPTPCGSASYGEVEDYTITVGGGPAGNPPQNLAGMYVAPNSAVLTWEAPEEDGEWLSFSGPNDGGLGLEGGGSFFVAAHWTQAQVAPYVGSYLTKVSIFPTSTDNATYVLKIWTGVSGSTLVHNQPLNGLVFDQWNDIVITTPLMIPSSDCWVGYQVTHNDLDNPAGLDAGPAVAGSGDMVSFDGVIWESMATAYGLDYNFNIKVFVSENTDGQVAQPLPNKISNNQNTNHQFTYAKRIGAAPSPTRGLTGYNIYRDEVMIGSTGLNVLTYTDAGLTPGTYDYTVKAVYTEGLSAAAGPVSVTIPSGGGPLIYEPFEDYTAGGYLAQQANALGRNYWTTWSNAPGTAEDPFVTNAQASAGSKSVVIEGTNDCVLLFGDKTSGNYDINFHIYVANGFLGYFNLLHAFAGASSEWGLQVYFDQGGAGLVDAAGAGAATFTFGYDVWIPIKVNVDLDNDWCKFWVNNSLVVEYQWSLGTFGTPGLNQLAAANFYAWADAAQPKYYIDEVSFDEAGSTPTDPTIAVNPTTLNENHQVPGIITTKTVTVSNIGAGTLNWNLTVNTNPSSDAVNPPDSPEAIARLQAREAQDGIAPPSLGFDPLGSRVPAGYKPADLKGLRGELAYGNNVEGNTFYELDVATLAASVIGTTTYAAFCGDFAPGDVDNMYIIDYNDDVLKMVDIATGVATPIASVPCPMAGSGGIWTELAIDKTTGIFYATATDINASNLYTIDPASGAVTLVGNCGIAAVISCTIDLTGTMYAFDIVSDNCYTIDLATGVGTLLGPAGFNGNYAQGMGYDPVNDKVYLAAYSTFAELRELNTTTGATTALGALPGETGAFGFPYQGGPQPGVDVGVTAFVSPVSGPYLGNETVTIKVKNFGTNSVSNIPVSYTLDGGAAVTGTLAGPIASGATADFTFPGTVNLGNPGQTYVFVGCTALAGDENSNNNCKTANVTNVIPTYCDATTQVEDEYIANVLCGDINNTSGWQGGVADYTNITTTINAGESEDIVVTNGNAWASDIVYCWADWNKDFTFGTGDEQFMLTNVGGTGQTFTGAIAVPAGTPNGEYRLRIRMTYSTAPAPCGDATYGEVEDYTITVGGSGPNWLSVNPTNGSIGAGQNNNITLNFNAAGLPNGQYGAKLHIANNSATPVVDVDVTMLVGSMDWYVNPSAIAEVHNNPPQITYKTVTVTNNTTSPLNWNLVVNTSPTSDAINPPDSPEAIAALMAREAQDGIAPPSLGLDPLGSRVPAGYKPADLKGLRGELAYGNNVEGNTFYELDVETLAASVIGTTTYAAFCGDFAPGDVDNMYIIDYNDDVLKMVDIATGVATPIASVPCPMAGSGGIWTELAIDKTTGIFYATATDINASNLYTIDPASGAVTLVGNCGIAAVISCTIDLTGTMYAFDIVSDNCYTIDLATGVGTLLGPAGFNGNYAQGMGYDPVNDKVYLAAYSTFAELRELNTTTGATTALGALPGETGAFGFPYQGGPQPGVDVGVTAFVSPVSGPYLGNETVTIKVKNFGTNSVSNIPVSYTLDGGAAVTGTLAGPIASGATADFTFPGTVNLGNPGQTYVFVGCTALAGDENSNNNCKTANVTNVIPTYCDATTQVEDEYIANVLCGDINNTSGWQGGVADYTNITTTINAGESEDIVVTNGNAWASDIVYCWADWNKDFTFGTGDEQFMLTNVGGTGQTFTGAIAVPAGTPNGEYRLRIRMTYSTAPQPCGDATYGEVEDYTITVGGGTPTAWLSADILSGTIAPNGTATVTVTLNSTTLATGTYTGSLVFSAAANPASITVPVTLTVMPTGGAVIAVNPGSFLFVLEYNQTETQTMTVSNTGTAALNCVMTITYDNQAPVFNLFDVEAYRSQPSTAHLNAERAPETVPGTVINTTDAMWDLQFSAPAGDASGEAGIETDGNFIYTTKWNGAGFFKYEMDGTFIGPMTVGSVQGIRDLAFDGTYMYGGAAATTVYKMDFSTQTLIGQFTAPTAVRAIAYDYDEDGFYANNWSTPIVLFDASGATLNTLPTAGDESYYGFAYDNNNGSKHLYGFSQKVGLSGGVIFELALPGGTPTGVSHDVVTELATPGTDLAGGLFTCNNWFVNGTTSIGGLVQNVVLFAYELHATQGPVEWLSLSTYNATVAPNGSANVGVICNTDDFDGELYYASIWIANNSTNNQMVEVPVTLDLIDAIGENGADAYVMMYPNPTTDFVNIKSNSNINQVRIFNQAGQLVLSQEANGYDVRVETNNFNTGTYFVEISSAAGVVTSKLIVK